MLPIVTYPHPTLLSQADVVNFPLDHETKTLIKDMWATVRGQGVGLAAPQVGVSKQICIIYLSESERGAQAKDIVMINPKITFYSQKEHEMVEGCLSFPSEYYKIWRPANIHVEYQDETGKRHVLKAKDWLSRVIQHEVDHLNAKLFINLGGIKLDPKDFDDDQIVD
jgi:peptide deformylase